MGKKRIGEFLVELGVLTEEEVKTILDHSKSTGLKFAEAAVNLGMLHNDAPLKLAGTGISVDFFHLIPEYFPVATKDVIPLSTILKYGVLPLGVKHRNGIFRSSLTLNLGQLNPRRHEAPVLALNFAQKNQPEIKSTKCYLILVDEFLHVLEHVYRVTPEMLAEQSEELDETLRMFLENSKNPVPHMQLNPF